VGFQEHYNCSHFGGKAIFWQKLKVNKTLHGQRSKIFCDHIRSLRTKAGMTQRDLSQALGREHGMVARIELGERRVDMIEAFDLFEALGTDPEKETAELMTKFKDAK